MEKNNSLEKLIYELQYLRSAAENVQQRIALINATITEVQLGISTLEGIRAEKSGQSILVPIGGGSYVRAKLDDSEKLIVGIGADIAVEKSVPYAKEDFQTRILELEQARMTLKKQLDEISTNISIIQREAQKLANQTRGEVNDV